MSLKMIVGVLIVIALTLYISYFNPAKISIVVYKDISYEFPMAFFVFGLFFLGALISTVIHSLKSYRKGIRNWRESAQSKKEKQIEESFSQGLRALWEGRLKDAKSYFSAVLDRHPDHVYALIKLGDSYRLEGNYPEAIKLHLKARSIEGDTALVLKSLESDYRQDNRKRELAEILERLRKQDLTNLDPLIKLRDVVVEEEDWPKALTLQKEVIQTSRNAVSHEEEIRFLGIIQYEMANLLRGKGDFEAAIAEYRKSIKSYEKFLPSYLALGEALMAIQNENNAVKVWKSGFKSTGAIVLLKCVENHYLERERPSLAIEFYHEALSLTENDPYVSLLLGELYLRLEMIDEAFKEFQRIEKDFQQLSEFHFLLGRIYQKSSQAELAEEEFKAVFNAKGLMSMSYLCHHCLKRYRDWIARCPNCHRWNRVDLAPVVFD